MGGGSDYQRFRARFREAMDPRLYPIAYLDGLVRSGIAHFRCTERAAIVFALRQYPSGASDVHGLVAAGDMNEIVERLIPEAEAWGKQQGCIGALIESRAGWARLLKRHGYEPHQMAVRKEL